MTEKLYDTDAYLSTFSAQVLSCTPWEDGYEIELDRTAFFPEGGGQYGDRGLLNGIAVSDTQMREERIFHRTSQPLPEGTQVTGQVDFARRFRHMQHHSGEHIVSGLVHSMFGFDNVGFHLGDGEMTMDYNRELSPADLDAVEKAANRALWDNREIRCEYPSSEELRSLQYRSKKELQGAVRIVTVEGIDVCACCAPHVKRTGEIGAIVITDALRWKGGTRITVRCGSDALAEYDRLRGDEKQLSALFSAPRGENAPAAERLMKEYGELRRAYGAVLKEKALLQISLLPQEPCGIFVLSDGDLEVMRAAANEGIARGFSLFVCLSGSTGEGYKYVISAQGGLRPKAKEINAALGGRGGGSDTMLQGSFSASEQEIRDYFKEFTI